MTPRKDCAPAESAPPRKVRCRVHDRLGNRCPNEALSDYGMCAKHLAGAAAEFRALTEAAQHARWARADGR